MSSRPAAVTYARSVLKGAASAVDRIQPPARGITMLIYHRVGLGAGGQMDLDPARFDEQLAWLADTQRVLTLDDAVAELEGHDPVAPGVVITFDDGTVDWVTEVAPALERHRLPATFYVSTGFVEDQIAFPHGGTPITWAGLEVLRDCGWATIGSHTHRHRLLDRLDPADLADELDRSVELLRDRLGVEATHFCYPKAVPPSEAAAEAVAARFATAVLAGTHANVAGADRYRLARSPVQASDSDRWFHAKAIGGLGAEDRLRAALNRRRYRGATD